MRLSQTDLFPVLTIVAGGLVGASLSFSFLGRSPAVGLPTPGWQPDTEPPVFVMPVVQSSFVQPAEVAKGFFVRPNQIAIVFDGQAVIYRDGETGRHYTVRLTDEEQAAFEKIELERRVGRNTPHP